MSDALSKLPADRLKITHQTGEGDFEKLREIYKKHFKPFVQKGLLL